MRCKNLSFEIMMNQAIAYLSCALNVTGHNDKPVLLHSIRVGFRLYELEYQEDIVISAILHDILEDTETLKNEVERNFGVKVTELITANSFNPLIEDKTERFKEMFRRCQEYGNEAFIIKAADILDNSYYIKFATDEETRVWLLAKMKYFIDL